MSRMIFHPFGECSDEGWYEFTFPVDRSQIPSGFAIPSTFETIADYDGVDAAGILFAKITGCRTQSMRAFVDWFSNFTPASLQLWDGTWCLRCSRNDFADYEVGNNFYFRTPLTEGITEELLGEFLADFGLECDAFSEFYLRFSGLRESTPGISGHFPYDEFVLFSGILNDDLGEQWNDSLCLYRALGGEILLLNEFGETAWYYHGSGSIKKFTETFPEFIAEYIHFNRICKDVFDPYAFENPRNLR